MGKDNKMHIVLIGSIIVFVLAIIMQFSVGSDKPPTEDDGATSASSSIFESTDSMETTINTDSATSQNTNPASKYITAISDIDPDILDKMKQYQSDMLEADFARDPARDKYFGVPVSQYLEADTLDYYNDRDRHVDNVRLYAIYLLQKKANKNWGQIIFCYACDYYACGKQMQCFFPLSYDIDLDNKYEPVDYIAIHDDEKCARLSFDDWYKDNITVRKGKYEIIDKITY